MIALAILAIPFAFWRFYHLSDYGSFGYGKKIQVRLGVFENRYYVEFVPRATVRTGESQCIRLEGVSRVPMRKLEVSVEYGRIVHSEPFGVKRILVRDAQAQVNTSAFEEKEDCAGYPVNLFGDDAPSYGNFFSAPFRYVAPATMPQEEQDTITITGQNWFFDSFERTVAITLIE